MSDQITQPSGIDGHDVIAVWLLVVASLVFFIDLL